MMLYSIQILATWLPILHGEGSWQTLGRGRRFESAGIQDNRVQAKGYAIATDEQLKKITKIPKRDLCAGESISTR